MNYAFNAFINPKNNSSDNHRKGIFLFFADKIEISRTLETKNRGKREREHKCWKSIKTAELQFVVVRVVLSIQDNSLKCLNEKDNEILPFDVLILLQKCAFSS